MKTSISLRPNRPRSLCATIALVFLFAHCDRPQFTDNGIEFRHWHVVEPMPGADVAVAYGNIKNATAYVQVLTKATFDCAGHTMLHETQENAGRVSMVHRKQIEMGVGESIHFEPGHTHVMLSELRIQPATNCQTAFTINDKVYRFAIPVRPRD